jgi:hypothetical protein
MFMVPLIYAGGAEGTDFLIWSRFRKKEHIFCMS